MEEELDDISSLVEKYEQMLAFGRKIYFDADEFAALADHYNSLGENEQAQEVIDEGLRMHPASPDLMVLCRQWSMPRSMSVLLFEQHPRGRRCGTALLRIETLLHLEKKEEANILINETISRELSIDDLYVFITEVGLYLNDVRVMTSHLIPRGESQN